MRHLELWLRHLGHEIAGVEAAPAVEFLNLLTVTVRHTFFLLLHLFDNCLNFDGCLYIN